MLKEVWSVKSYGYDYGRLEGLFTSEQKAIWFAKHLVRLHWRRYRDRFVRGVAYNTHGNYCYWPRNTLHWYCADTGEGIYIKAERIL